MSEEQKDGVFSWQASKEGRGSYLNANGPHAQAMLREERIGHCLNDPKKEKIHVM